MIRLLDEADRTALMAFAGVEPETNLFLLGDVENNGMRTEFQRVWGEFDAAGGMRGALLQFYENLIFYGPRGCDMDGFVALIESCEFKYLSGGAVSLEPVCGRLRCRRIKRTTLCRLADAGKIDARPASEPIRRLRVADIDRMIEFYREMPEFGPPARESVFSEVSAGHARGFWIEADGEMISIARTAAENSRSAMIVGVGTRAAFRGRGYATALMAELCRELIAEGKTAVLFFDNPAAGNIYLRMGFEPIGDYVIVER